MTATLVIALIILAVYLTACILLTKHIPYCWSDTYYLLQPYRLQWLFQVVLIVCAILIVPTWLDRSPENIRLLAFLCCGALAFVGCAPLFKKEDRKMHYICASIAALTALTWAGIVNFVGLCIALVAMLNLSVMFRGKWLFITETITFLLIIALLIFYL